MGSKDPLLSCCREQYTRKIQEQENLGKGLREKQKHLKENQDSQMQQMTLWRDLQRIMELKMNPGKSGGYSQSPIPSRSKADGVSFSTGPDAVYEDEDRLVL